MLSSNNAAAKMFTENLAILKNAGVIFFRALETKGVCQA